MHRKSGPSRKAFPQTPACGTSRAGPEAGPPTLCRVPQYVAVAVQVSPVVAFTDFTLIVSGPT